MVRRAAAGTLLLGFVLALPVRASNADDEKLLRDAQVGAEGPALLAFFQRRSAAPPTPEQIAKVVAQLRDKDRAGRATGELVGLGKAALAALRADLLNPAAVEARDRVRACLDWIEGARSAELNRAAVRQLVRRKPDGSVKALLAYFPRAEDELTAAEVREALASLAVRGDRADPDLLAAAQGDADLDRRLLALTTLYQARAAEADKAVSKLLADPRAAVRLRGAQALLELREPEAMPVLVGLLGELPQEEGRPMLEVLKNLAGPLAPSIDLPADAAGRERCRDAWAAWWKEVDGKFLLDHFRKVTPAADLDRVGDLVKKLGDRSFRVREQAAEELVLLRGLALPHLAKAAQDPDIDLRRRAERCIEAIRNAPDAPRSAAYVRLLALRRPPGALAALVGYVAFADDESVVEEVRQGARAVARRDPQAAKVLRAALGEKAAVRRGLAAEVLADIDWPASRDRLREILQDTDPQVRWRTASALAHQEDERSLPVLIDLLEVLPSEAAWQAEDLLRRVAGEQAPREDLGSDGAQRRKARTAWLAWHKQHGASADLGRLKVGDGSLGYTLVSLWNPAVQVNEIAELGRDKKPRWKIENLGFSFDFELLPGARLLCPENNQNRVTERNFKGDVLWEHKIPSPINAQRLPDGNTFIAAASLVVVVDRSGKEVFRNDKLGGVMMGQRLPSGHMLIVLGDGTVVRLDSKGNEVKRYSIGSTVSNFGGVHALPDGRLLVALFNRNAVLEFDADGKQTWKADVQSPNFATRLPNGHTLVGSQDAQTLWELDRQGKAVWEHKPGMGVWRARRR